jgi:hypothetical protein
MGVWYIAAAHPHVNHTPKTQNPQGAKLLVNPTNPHENFCVDQTAPTCYTHENRSILFMLPTQSPAEVLKISPEALEVANCYLQTGSTREVADALQISTEQVVELLDRSEVKRYIDHVWMETGFNNRSTMRSAMDQVIKQKFQELEESGTGSTKDIADLLALSHKMSMEYLDRQIELQKLQAKQTELQVKNQVNVQINEGVPIGDGSKYAQLIGKLLESNRDAAN